MPVYEQGDKVKAFHPRTLGVPYWGTVTKAYKGENGEVKGYRVDFAPTHYKGKTSFWVSTADVVGCDETTAARIVDENRKRAAAGDTAHYTDCPVVYK